MSMLKEGPPRLAYFGLTKPGNLKVEVEVVEVGSKEVVRKGEVPREEFFSGNFNPLSVPLAEGGKNEETKGLA